MDNKVSDKLAGLLGLRSMVPSFRVWQVTSYKRYFSGLLILRWFCLIAVSTRMMGWIHPHKIHRCHQLVGSGQCAGGMGHRNLIKFRKDKWKVQHVELNPIPVWARDCLDREQLCSKEPENPGGRFFCCPWVSSVPLEGWNLTAWSTAAMRTLLAGWRRWLVPSVSERLCLECYVQFLASSKGCIQTVNRPVEVH